MKTVNILIIFLLVSSVVLASDARRLNAVASLDAVKEGPSPGEGHGNVNAYTLGGVKESGPSPGEGHKYTDAKPLGGVKDSGPSPGAGH